ncbi:MAG: hypothetical protein AB7E70_03710 [Hyphomicrobiaceae bacterium]
MKMTLTAAVLTSGILLVAIGQIATSPSEAIPTAAERAITLTR